MDLSNFPENIVQNDVMNDSCKFQANPINKLKIIKSLIVLGLSFLFHFSTIMALTNLQSTLNTVGNIGVISQSLIYSSVTISSLFLPKLIIKQFGCKTTTVISILAYVPYIAANIHPTAWTLLPTAVLLGAGSATLWCSASTYINDISFLYADRDEEKAKLITSRFFGIFITFFQCTEILGNLVTYIVLEPSGFNSTGTFSNSNFSVDTVGSGVLCGANFCGGISQVLQSPPEERLYMLIGIYLSLSVLAALISAVFLDTFATDNKDKKDSVIMKLLATFKQMRNMDQLLLVALTTFTGFQLGFIFGDYTEAYVACSWGLQNIALVFVFFGFANASVSFFAGYMVKYVPMIVLMSTAAASNVGTLVALLNWSPSKDQPLIFFIVVGFWAFSDGIWQTQLSALYGVIFREEEEAAFANYRLWEALGFAIAFGCSGVLCTNVKIYMQLIFLCVGYIGYIIVELRIFWKKKCYVVK